MTENNWEVLSTRKCIEIYERRRVPSTDWFSKFLVSLGFVSAGYKTEYRTRYEFRGLND